MKSRMPCLLATVCLIAALAPNFAHAATKVLTKNDQIKLWLAAVGKEFKRVKAADTYVTFSPFASRVIDSMEVTGLQSAGTNFSGLNLDLQNAITKLRTDLDTLRDKQSDFAKLVNSLMDDVRTAARTGTPPSVQDATVLFSAVYAAVFDGVIVEKEKTAITTAGAAVTATAGLDPKIVTDIQGDITALVIGAGVSKADLTIIKADMAAIATILKTLQ
jgi:hypothetical protein